MAKAKLTPRERLAKPGRDAEGGTLKLKTRASVEQAQKTKMHPVSLSDEEASSDDQSEIDRRRHSNSGARSSQDTTAKVQEQMTRVKISDREGEEDFVGAAGCTRQNSSLKGCGLCS